MRGTVKSVEQQVTLMLQNTRDQLVRQRTASINALRIHLSARGIVAAERFGGVTALIKRLPQRKEKIPAHA